ncbi:MAG TPA: MFS transporter [Terriglobia bacterium]|nr:MFS transporter [Terriglobia bacterium]
MFKPTPIQSYLLKISFIGTFAEMMLTPIYLALANRFGGNVLDAGLGFCVFNVATGLLVFTFGQSKFFEQHKKWMVFVGFLICGLCDVGYAGISLKWQYYCLQAVGGAGIGLANPAWDSVYEDEDHDEEGNGASKWSFWTGGISFVVGAGSLLGGLVADKWGLRPLFFIMAGTDAVAVYYAWRMARFYQIQ